MDKTIIIGVGGLGGSLAKVVGSELGCDTLIINYSHTFAEDKALAHDQYLLLERAKSGKSTVESAAIAAEAVVTTFLSALSSKQKVIFTVGLGGHTGSGAIPVLLSNAKQQGREVVVVATMPFRFEEKRRLVAETALAKIRSQTDKVILHDLASSHIAPDNALQYSLSEHFAVLAKGICLELTSS